MSDWMEAVQDLELEAVELSNLDDLSNEEYAGDSGSSGTGGHDE